MILLLKKALLWIRLKRFYYLKLHSKEEEFRSNLIMKVWERRVASYEKSLMERQQSELHIKVAHNLRHFLGEQMSSMLTVSTCCLKSCTAEVAWGRSAQCVGSSNRTPPTGSKAIRVGMDSRRSWRSFLGAISGAEHQFPRETEVVPLIIGQGSLSEVENALVLAAVVEEGPFGGNVIAV